MYRYADILGNTKCLCNLEDYYGITVYPTWPHTDHMESVKKSRRAEGAPNRDIQIEIK